MKNLLSLSILIVFGVLTVSAQAQTEKEINGDIKAVTVYQQGAQVTRESSFAVPRGNTTLVFKGLSSKITPQSLQAKLTNDVMITSVTHSIDYLNKNAANKEITSLNDKQRLLLDSIKVLNNLKAVYADEKDMILANKSIGGKDGLNVAELEQTATFFRKRLIDIEVNTHKLDNQIIKLRTDVTHISKQLLELNARVDQPTSVVKIGISSDKETRTELSLSYFIPDAIWQSNYDIRIKEVNQPMNMVYKAKVSQNTGEDWNNVKLMFSTGNPSYSNLKPELDPYYLTFYNYYRPVSNLNQVKTPFNGLVRGRIVTVEDGNGIPGATVLVKGSNIAVITDVDGNFQVNVPAGYNTLQASFVGCETQELPINSGYMNIALKTSTQQLEGVVVTAMGASRDGDYDDNRLSGKVSGINVVKKKEAIPMAIEKTQLTTEFQINIPYSIPSDNKPYDVSMVDYEIDALYNYSAVPKLSYDAFLIARIPDWYKYKLLNGSVNVFYKGIYQGATELDLTTAGDTLTLSIGKDRDIVVSREIQKDFASRSFMSGTKKEQKAWQISIKNNKDVPVNIVVEDQYPISKNDDIKVDVIETSGAKADEATGKLTWDLRLNPAEKKQLNLRYAVKYPASKPVIVE